MVHNLISNFLKKFQLCGVSYFSVFMCTFKLASVMEAIFKDTLQIPHCAFVFFVPQYRVL